jgi:long-chain acyl-CoA synthetase
MDLELGKEFEDFRSEVREWIEDNRPSGLEGIGPMAFYTGAAGLAGRTLDIYEHWNSRLLEAKLVCPQWPDDVGGRGFSGIHMAILNEEFARARAPRVVRGMGEILVGPSIIVHGTDAQKQYFLPRILSGEDVYCQGFSEPDHGSDLGSVETRGVVDGEEIVITGQKVWTSGAHVANMIFILCRTDPDAPKHRGLSYVLAPMANNGITVAPIRQPHGASNFNQEFIEQARAPLFNVIGGLNNGWRVAMTTLGNERGGTATTAHLAYEREFWDLVEETRKRGRSDDLIVRQQLAWSYTHTQLMRFQGLRLLATLAAKKEPGPEASVSKLFWSEYHKRLGEISMGILGAEGSLAEESGSGRYQLGRWQSTFVSSLTGTIASGTSEIQRNIIAERSLGLPKDPAPRGRKANAAHDERDPVRTDQAAANNPRAEFGRNGMLLAYWARLRPDKPAIISPGGHRTFGELNARCNQLARALRRRGLGAGDAVSLICGNRPGFGEAMQTVLRSGLRLTPINCHLRAQEAAYIIEDCDAKALIADYRFAELCSAAVTDNSFCSVRLAVGGQIDTFEDYEASLNAEDPSDISDPVLGSRMMYTSGTTGRPKGVHRSEPIEAGSPAASAAATAAAGFLSFAPDGSDMNLCTGPLYHSAVITQSLNAPLAAGVGTVLMERWDAEEALRLIERHRITHTHMVPTMFHRLLSLPEDTRTKYDISSLRSVVHGAAPCPVSVKRRMIDWFGPIIWEYFGATEGGGGSVVDSQTWLEHPGTVGRPIVQDQVKIGDPDGNELPIEEVGLVFVKAPERGRFAYYKDPEKTASAYRGEYFTLGDVGFLDREGYLYLTDRSANLIISGGVNIYPAEVDAVLLEHPAVSDAATIGIPDAEWGEQIRAVVQLQSGWQPSDELATELVDFCKRHLARFKCPRSIDFVDELPRQDNGKIYKHLLRDQYRMRAAQEGS